MITDQDIQKLKIVIHEVVRDIVDGPFRELRELHESMDGMNGRFDRLELIVIKSQHDITELKEDVTCLRESVQGLIIANDGVVKTLSEMRMENAAVAGQTTRHDRWIRQLANGTKIKLSPE